MIKYLGSKKLLIPTIEQIVRSLPDVGSAIDLFSGTSRVGHALKRSGVRVIANDLMSYAHTLASCYVQADAEDVLDDASRIIDELNTTAGRPGFFTETYCVQSRFFHPTNGERIDAIRERIESLSLEPVLRSVVLVSLMEAADRVDSTTGLQMAYLKQWAKRAHKPLHLRVPDVLPSVPAGACEAHQLDAEVAAELLTADLAYIDPPYNQHAYLGNYHIWETLTLWDKPDVYGVACKRIDCKTRKSEFNSKPKAADALARVLRRVRTPYMIVSFNNEGYIPRETMEELLGAHGCVHTLAHDFKRYVGAQIGIHNPKGKRVGRVSHLRNTEYLYVVVPHSSGWSPEECMSCPPVASPVGASS